MDNVVEIEDFLTPEWCSKIIEKIDEYDQFAYEYSHNRKILKLDPLILDDLLIKKVCYAITRIVQDVTGDTYLVPDYQELVRWESGSSCPSHTDFSHQRCSSILYLNDDFDGGETVINGVPIVPKLGKIIIFNGTNVEHEVNKVTKGVRFVIPSWFV